MENKKRDIRPLNVKGKAHGEWIVYYSNGQLRFKGEYIDGKEVGMWKEWNINTEEYDNIFYG